MAINTTAAPAPAAPPHTSSIPESDELELTTTPSSAKDALANAQNPENATPIADGKITQRTYTMVDRIDSNGKVRTYCVWIAVTDADTGKFLRYGNVNSPKFNDSVTKLLKVAGEKDGAACDKIFAKGAGQISFNIDRQAKNLADPQSNEITTKITLKNSTSQTSLTLSDEDTAEETDEAPANKTVKEAVTSFISELIALRKEGFLINPKGKSEADPRSLFGGETDNKDAPLGADGKPIQYEALDKTKELTHIKQRECLEKMVPPDEFPKVALFPNHLTLSTLNVKETTTKRLNENYQKSPVFMPVQHPDGRSLYLCLDKANKALYYYDPSTTHEIQSQQNNRVSRFLENSIFEGKTDPLRKTLHDFCNTHGVQNLYAPTNLYKNGSSNSHNGLQWFKHLSDQPNLSSENAFPKTKMGDVKIPMTPAEIEAADTAAAASKKAKEPVETDDDIDSDDELEAEEEEVVVVGAAEKAAAATAATAKPEPVKPPKPLELTVADALIAKINTPEAPVSVEKKEEITKWVTALKQRFDMQSEDIRQASVQRWKSSYKSVGFNDTDDDLLCSVQSDLSKGLGLTKAKIAEYKLLLTYLAKSHEKWLLEPAKPEVLEASPPPHAAPPAGKATAESAAAPITKAEFDEQPSLFPEGPNDI